MGTKGDMTSIATLSRIEERIYQLPLDEQLWLIERLAQKIRNSVLLRSNFETQLADMADDPEISKELQMIEDMQDLAIIAERCAEPTVSHDALLVELKHGGLILSGNVCI